MTMLQHGLVPSTGGYQIERSLRFNSADSAYLSRTPASTTNRRTWTYSCWVKKAKNDDNYPTLLSAYNDQFYFNLNDTLSFYFNGSPAFATEAKFRDNSAWYHIVLVVDTTQATGTDRFKLYVNNVAQVFNAYFAPAQNTDGEINNSTRTHQIGRLYTGNYYLNGYLAEVHFVDGQALTPSSFGETDTDTGVWKPKAYSGSYGTNGFYLKFADNSGTTSTTLGKDSSGNGNNWTPNNFSVTAGAGNDSLVDTPTPYGTDTGAGGEVRGNYCTLNPLNNPANSTLTNGNLDVTTASSTGGRVVGTIGVSSGKWYWEITPTSVAGISLIGIAAASRVSSDGLGDFSNDYAYQNNGNKYSNSSATSYGASYVANDVIGVALDLDAGTLVFYKNNSSQGTAYSSISGTFVPAMSDGQNGGSSAFVCNFGQRPFAYTAPSGFKALCTQNLPTPTIGATATTRADDYFNTVLYTGTGSAQSITGVGFQPDFLWVKPRNNANVHHLIDAVRGIKKHLFSNNTNAEETANAGTGFTSFDSDGFSLGTDTSTTGNTNLSTVTYAAWNWKANGAGSSNTQGSITSTVSANTTSGFSIVTYTGNSAADQTVGHGLGVTPAFIMVKSRGNTDPWVTYHTSMGANKFLYLNTTDAESTVSGYWGTPSSTTFGIKGGGWANNPSTTVVAYCFAAVAGYSAFGSYTGNGSTDGPFVYTGFRPAFVLMKVTSTTDSWVIVDRTRSPYNVAKLTLFPNLSNAENDGAIEVDMLSNGFKLRTANSNVNASQTFIYAAFAEVPTKFSLAR